MAERSHPESSAALLPNEGDAIRAVRVLNLSPHPYHRNSVDLPHSAERFGQAPDGHATPQPSATKDSTPTSDSGTDADDEHFLRGLPAPRARLHKGLRGRNEFPSGISTPLASPAALEDEQPLAVEEQPPTQQKTPTLGRLKPVVARRQRVFVRRATEAGLVFCLACFVRASPGVHSLVEAGRQDFLLLALLFALLLLLYPLRLVLSTYRHRRPSRLVPFRLPPVFDSAPLLYPPTLTILLSLLASVHDPSAIFPGLVLSICSVPHILIPKFGLADSSYNILHWFLSCLPLIWTSPLTRSSLFAAGDARIRAETVVLLHPLHHSLSSVLHYLTTTSLLDAELQLLSISLVSLLLSAASPQMEVLKALLWVGGLVVLVFCRPVIERGISLARVPKWRFRRGLESPKHQLLKDVRKLGQELLGFAVDDGLDDKGSLANDSDDSEPSLFSQSLRTRTLGPNAKLRFSSGDVSSLVHHDPDFESSGVARRRTMPILDKGRSKKSSHTPSGRRKRATSSSVLSFFKLTPGQATLRQWLYALYVHLCLLATILIAVRVYVQESALDGREPIGWGLGYIFGDLPSFRFQVVRANLERWICLARLLEPETPNQEQSGMGWVQRLRQDYFGEANTRLLLCAYWLFVLVFGLLVVFRLRDRYEVDTRRKVFHFMMVAMFLPGTFVDPTFVALALSLVLAIFLMLDLLRASQLPPLSRPLASFLAPYVDGRDFRGPVVVSHIFLLIGCAIPLWLALATLPRTGKGCLAGWEVPTRDVSMVAGVICVGLGDAAASLIGRRHGHHKWLWGGGKSLEGSVAFAAAVFAGLTAARAWLHLGGWPTTDDGHIGQFASARNAGICASIASMTEAALTGANDNVIVPVVLWTCVKSFGV